MEVHEAGGGIMFTVDRVRKASEDQLYAAFKHYAMKMLQVQSPGTVPNWPNVTSGPQEGHSWVNYVRFLVQSFLIQQPLFRTLESLYPSPPLKHFGLYAPKVQPFRQFFSKLPLF